MHEIGLTREIGRISCLHRACDAMGRDDSSTPAASDSLLEPISLRIYIHTTVMAARLKARSRKTMRPLNTTATRNLQIPAQLVDVAFVRRGFAFLRERHSNPLRKNFFRFPTL